MKETEEELLKKSKDKVATELGYKDFQDLWRHWGINEKYLNKVARRYCKEYIRNLLPSVEEIVSQVRHSTVDPDYIYGYEEGVRKVLELLTKGDR